MKVKAKPARLIFNCDSSLHLNIYGNHYVGNYVGFHMHMEETFECKSHQTVSVVTQDVVKVFTDFIFLFSTDYNGIK
jgi:hypothetical protein